MQHYGQDLDLTAGDSVYISTRGNAAEAVVSAMVTNYETGKVSVIKDCELCLVCKDGCLFFKFTAVGAIKGFLAITTQAFLNPCTFCWPVVEEPEECPEEETEEDPKAATDRQPAI